MRLLPKSIHRCRRYPTKFNSGRDIPCRKAGGGSSRTRRRNRIASHLRGKIVYNSLWLSLENTMMTRAGPSLAAAALSLLSSTLLCSCAGGSESEALEPRRAVAPRHYPDIAVLAFAEGVVSVDVRVDKDGNVVDARVVDIEGPTAVFKRGSTRIRVG